MFLKIFQAIPPMKSLATALVTHKNLRLNNAHDYTFDNHFLATGLNIHILRSLTWRTHLDFT